MLKVFAFLLAFVSFHSFAESNFEKLQNIKELKRIAFGSCNNEQDHQPLWRDIIEHNPDLWIWGGDNIYADWGKSLIIELAYKKQNANLDYKAFKSRTPIIGTWDDHDYAYNNAGGLGGI
jgi:alkaline phosphatase D